MPAVQMIAIAGSYPLTDQERFNLAREAFQQLTESWDKAGLPHFETMYVLICRPGQLARSAGQGIHIADQASGMAETDPRGEPVLIILTDAIEGGEDFLALRWRKARGTMAQPIPRRRKCVGGG
jgi:hypothetical protein